MKVKFIKSIITELPNFRGSLPTSGGKNTDEFIEWYRIDSGHEFHGFTDAEANTLLTLLNSKCSANLRSSTIEEVEQDDIPSVSLAAAAAAENNPIVYYLSELVNYSSLFDFEIVGYHRANHRML